MIGTSSDLTASITGGSERPSPDAVAQLAYQLYLMRGRRDGHDVEDWLIAERELTEHYRWLKSA